MDAKTHHKSVSVWKFPLKKKSTDPMFRAYTASAAS